MFEGSAGSGGPLQRLRFEARPRFVLLGAGAAVRGRQGCWWGTAWALAELGCGAAVQEAEPPLPPHHLQPPPPTTTALAFGIQILTG